MNVSQFPPNVTLLVGSQGSGKTRYLHYIEDGKKQRSEQILRTAWFSHTFDALFKTLHARMTKGEDFTTTVLLDEVTNNDVRDIVHLASIFPRTKFLVAINKEHLS